MGKRNCDTKIRHKTIQAAYAHIRGMRRLGAISKGCVINPYRCVAHRCWHVGNKSRERKYGERMEKIFGGT